MPIMANRPMTLNGNSTRRTIAANKALAESSPANNEAGRRTVSRSANDRKPPCRRQRAVRPCLFLYRLPAVCRQHRPQLVAIVVVGEGADGGIRRDHPGATQSAAQSPSRSIVDPETHAVELQVPWFHPEELPVWDLDHQESVVSPITEVFAAARLAARPHGLGADNCDETRRLDLIGFQGSPYPLDPISRTMAAFSAT